MSPSEKERISVSYPLQKEMISNKIFYSQRFLIHSNDSSLVSGKRQWPLVVVVARVFGAVMALYTAKHDVGEHVSSLYPKE